MDVGIWQESLVGRVTKAFEAIHLQAPERIDRAEVIGDEHASPWPRDPGKLGHRELRAAHVVENPDAGRDVEGRIREGQRGRVSLDETDVRRGKLAPGVQEFGSRVDRDDLADVGSEREREGAGARAGVERDLTP